MRKTKLKEMYIVRYADDFRIFCRTKTDAQKTMLAVTQWLQERLRLEVSVEKTRIVNVKRKYSEFLGFKIRVHPKGKKQVIESHICDKQLKRISKAIHTQALNIERIRPKHTEANEVRLYNSMVMGIQNYYCIATHINKDCAVMQYQMPKGSFVVMKTGTHPMRTKLKLFYDWGIRFEKPLEMPDRGSRPVHYAGKNELEQAILKAYPVIHTVPAVETAQTTGLNVKSMPNGVGIKTTL